MEFGGIYLRDKYSCKLHNPKADFKVINYSITCRNHDADTRAC